MCANAGSPAKVADGVIDASLAGVALTLECISSDCAERGPGIASPHKDRVGGVSKVMDAGARSGLVCTYTKAWRCRKPKSGRSHGVGVGLECHYRQSIGKAQKSSNNSSKGVAREPNIRVRISLCDVVV